MGALDRHVVMVGAMGVGKSTVGGLVATQLGRPLHDQDHDLEVRWGSTGREIAALHGIAHLHRLEAELLVERLQEAPAAVITAAASTVESETCRAWLRRAGLVIWLRHPTGDLADRVARAAHRRPVSEEESGQLALRRAPLFEAVADHTLDATAAPGALAGLVIEAVSVSTPRDVTL